MTDHDAIAARVRQDREAGTPGPWVHDDQLPQWINMHDDNGAVWNVATAHVCCGHPVDGSAANARRIAALPDLEAAYLDLYDEVQRLRAERDALQAQCCMCGKTGLSTIEDGGPECELDDGRWVCSVKCYDRAASHPLAAEAERDRLRAVLDDALVACRIVDAVARAGHEKIGDLVLHMLSAVEPARAALQGDTK